MCRWMLRLKDEPSQRMEPYDLLYGNRAFLVGHTDWTEQPQL